METLCRIFDAIDERMPLQDWNGLACDFQQLMRCEQVAYYSIKLPAEEPRNPKIIMASHPGRLRDYWEKGVYKTQFFDEEELPNFVPIKSSSIVADKVFEQHPIYQNWGKYCGFFYVIFAPVMLTSFELLMLALSRPREAEDFDDQDCYRLGLAARYLRRFVQAQHVPLPLEAIELSSYFSSPVAIFDGQNITAMNDAFADWGVQSRLLNANGNSGNFYVNDKRVLEKLRNYYSSLRAGNIDPALPPKMQISIRVGDEGKTQHTIQIMPLSKMRGGSVKTIWFVHEFKPNLNVANYGAEMHLTPTEIEILTDLANGLSARTIAQSTDKKYVTIRWHIKNILSKCGVDSQRALLSKIFTETHCI